MEKIGVCFISSMNCIIEMVYIVYMIYKMCLINPNYICKVKTKYMISWKMKNSHYYIFKFHTLQLNKLCLSSMVVIMS